MLVNLQVRLQVQLTRAVFILGRGDNFPRLNDLQRMDREDGIRGCLHFNRATVAGEIDGATDRLSINSEPNHRPAAEERIARLHVSAPVIVVEFLIIGDVDVGAVNAYRHIARHLIRSTDEG